MSPKASKTPGQDERLSRLLDDVEEAFEAEEFTRALELADEATALAPHSVDALHYRAAALGALGRLDESHEAYGVALREAPEDLEVLHGAVELLVLDLCEEREALEDALDLAKRAIRLARKQGDREHLADFQILAAMAQNKLGFSRRALELLDEAERARPDDGEVWLERGIALWELCRFDDARCQFERVLAQAADEAWAHHYLGTLAEREGDHAAAQRHFAAARRSAPEDFPAPVELSPKAFDKAVEDALERLPDRVRRYLENVSILVEDLPSEEDLRASEPPLSPGIVGLFHGTPITEKTTSDPWSHFPSAILLYQRNLQRFARSRDELLEQIGITLIHEVGHFLGLSEEDLYERGLD